jgi:predicted oxidoreductase
MVQSVEASLKRLKTNYIDLYWPHVWDFLTPVKEVMQAFDDLILQAELGSDHSECNRLLCRRLRVEIIKSSDLES